MKIVKAEYGLSPLAQWIHLCPFNFLTEFEDWFEWHRLVEFEGLNHRGATNLAWIYRCQREHFKAGCLPSLVWSFPDPSALKFRTRSTKRTERNNETQ